MAPQGFYFGSRLIGIMLTVLFLASCAGANKAGPQPVNITLTDNSIQSSSATYAPGPITFHISNTSKAEVHEFVIIKTDLNTDKLPMGTDGNVDEEKLTSPGEKGDIAVGQTTDLTLTLPAGHYMFICNLPGHFKTGMHTTFTVQ